ncbi:MAG: hypothetical protein RSC10_09740 [Longicatena sp.]
MVEKEIDISVPFDTVQKTYPNGDILIKKYKFTSFKLKKGYEEIKENEYSSISYLKSKETYSSFIQDYKDKKKLREFHSSELHQNSDDIVPSVDIFQSINNQKNDDHKRNKKILYNIAKTRNKIYDIARSNDFNYFITLTYSSDKCDRYSFSECSKKVRKFMNHFKEEHKIDCPNFKYLLVHEQHKDGAYHYHGLIYLEDTNSLSKAKRQPKGLKQTVYNWSRWKNGFSTVTHIKNVEATRKYILKYISKNIDDDYQKGQRHFYYSHNCLKPVVESFISDEQILVLYTQIYDTERSTGYESTVSDIDEMIKLIANIQYGI